MIIRLFKSDDKICILALKVSLGLRNVYKVIYKILVNGH